MTNNDCRCPDGLLAYNRVVRVDSVPTAASSVRTTRVLQRRPLDFIFITALSAWTSSVLQRRPLDIIFTTASSAWTTSVLPRRPLEVIFTTASSARTSYVLQRHPLDFIFTIASSARTANILQCRPLDFIFITALSAGLHLYYRVVWADFIDTATPFARTTKVRRPNVLLSLRRPRVTSVKTFCFFPIETPATGLYKEIAAMSG